MFGMANQLLAVTLVVVTAVLRELGPGPVRGGTLVPMAFVLATTGTTGYLEITGKFFAMTKEPATALRGWLNIGLDGDAPGLRRSNSPACAAAGSPWPRSRKPAAMAEA